MAAKKALCHYSGEIQELQSGDQLDGYLRTVDVDDTPVDGVTDAPPSSNWAYDHENATAAHGATGAVVGTTNAQTVTNKTLGNYIETVYTITDGASVDLDPDNGPIQIWTLGASRSPTATNWAAGQSMTLMVDDGTGYSITWPSVTWIGGSAPTLATSGYSVISMWKVGTTLYGVHLGDVA